VLILCLIFIKIPFPQFSHYWLKGTRLMPTVDRLA